MLFFVSKVRSDQFLAVFGSANQNFKTGSATLVAGLGVGT